MPDPSTRASEQLKSGPSIGLALGAGGANGLAHLLMLEVFDELGIRPARIAGSSVGAFFGAVYAAGWDARQIRELLLEVIPANSENGEVDFLDMRILNLLESIEPAWSRGGLVSGARILKKLLGNVDSENLEDLGIPTQIVATDHWSREQVVYDRGPLRKLLHASMAVPGTFEPVQYEDRVLVDGGLSNPVPFDLLLESTDITVAVDVIGVRKPVDGPIPGALETLFHAMQILRENIMVRQLELGRPDIYVKPDIVNIRMLDVLKMDTILKQAQPAKDQLKAELERAIEQFGH